MPDAAIHVVSSTFINDDINELINDDLDGSLRLTIPLTFLILLLAFGAIVASVIPLVLAVTSLAAAYGLLGLYSQTVGAGQPERDPADRPDGPRGRGRLLAVHGHALPDGAAARRDRPDADRDRRAARPGGRCSSRGIAVVISLGGLVTLGISLFTSMAVGTMGVVLVSVIGSLTFLPATLAIVGDRVNLGRPVDLAAAARAALPIARSAPWRRALDWLDRRAARPPGSGFWARLVNAVMARPVLHDRPAARRSCSPLASPVARDLRTGTTDITGLPVDRSTASPGSSSQREVAVRPGPPARRRRHRRRPRRRRRPRSTAQGRALEIRRA